jgi:hypothetical protein
MHDITGRGAAPASVERGAYSVFKRPEDLREETLASASRAFDWRFRREGYRKG